MYRDVGQLLHEEMDLEYFSVVCDTKAADSISVLCLLAILLVSHTPRLPPFNAQAALTAEDQCWAEKFD